MKWISSVFLGFAFTTSSAFAGLTYDFTSTTSGVANQTITGNVKAEGTNMRIDIVRGDGALFEHGSFVVSTDHGQTMSVVNPTTKTFYQIDLSQLLGGAESFFKQLGSTVKLDVRNPKVSINGGAAGGTLEGYETKKSTIVSSYDIAVEGLGQSMSVQMQSSSDVWWTDKIPAAFTNFLQMRGIRTGIEAVDKLITAQAGTISGFPLKQATTTKISFNGNDMTTNTTSLVSNVKTLAVNENAFKVPEGFSRTESPIDRIMKGR